MFGRFSDTRVKEKEISSGVSQKEAVESSWKADLRPFEPLLEFTHANRRAVFDQMYRRGGALQGREKDCS